MKALARVLRPFRPTDEVGDLSAMLLADVDQGSEDSRRHCPFTPTPVTTSARLLLLGDRRRLGSRSVGSRRPAGVLPRWEDPAVRAGALPRRPKLEQARHQPWQRRDPRRAHRRRLGAAENRCRELAMRRRAQPRASTHQPARPDFCPCPLHLVSAIRPESFSRNYQSWRPCRAARRLPIRRSAPQLAIKFAPGSRRGGPRSPRRVSWCCHPAPSSSADRHPPASPAVRPPIARPRPEGCPSDQPAANARDHPPDTARAHSRAVARRPAPGACRADRRDRADLMLRKVGRNLSLGGQMQNGTATIVERRRRTQAEPSKATWSWLEPIRLSRPTCSPRVVGRATASDAMLVASRKQVVGGWTINRSPAVWSDSALSELAPSPADGHATVLGRGYR